MFRRIWTGVNGVGPSEMNNPDGFNYDLSQFPDSTAREPPQVFGAYDVNGQPIASSLPPGSYFGDLGDGIDENDPKRRRIARVSDFDVGPNGRY